MSDCPCGRRDAAGGVLPYLQCCGRYVEAYDSTPAPDAETLMRSRYSAFVLERAYYLLATWHASTRPTRLDANPAGLKWLGLAVQRHTVIDADHATVEFVARSKQGGRAERMHVTSRFERVDGRWLYVEDDAAL